ncbi:transposase [Bradyrhizobium neotropicale]
MGPAMIGLCCASLRQVPKRIVLNIDDTFDAVHGGQQLRLFNVHYDEYALQPIVARCAGRSVNAILRPVASR